MNHEHWHGETAFGLCGVTRKDMIGNKDNRGTTRVAQASKRSPRDDWTIRACDEERWRTHTEECVEGGCIREKEDRTTENKMERRVSTRFEKYWTESRRGDGQGHVEKEDHQSYRWLYMTGKARGKKKKNRIVCPNYPDDLLLLNNINDADQMVWTCVESEALNGTLANTTLQGNVEGEDHEEGQQDTGWTM